MTTGPLYPTNMIDESTRAPIMVTQIDVTTDSAGNASTASKSIDGEILKLYYDKGTIGASTTAVTTCTFSGEQIDSYNVNSGSVARYPLATATDSSTKVKFAVRDTLTVTVTSGNTSKAFSIYIYYR